MGGCCGCGGRCRRWCSCCDEASRNFVEDKKYPPPRKETNIQNVIGLVTVQGREEEEDFLVGQRPLLRQHPLLELAVAVVDGKIE